MIGPNRGGVGGAAAEADRNADAEIKMYLLMISS